MSGEGYVRYLSEIWLLRCIRHGGQGISGVLKLFAVKWFSGPSYLCTCYCVDLGLGWMRLEMWMTQWVYRYTCMHCYWWSCLFNACRDTLCPGTKHATFRFQGSLPGSIPQLTLWDDGWDGSVCSCISTCACCPREAERYWLLKVFKFPCYWNENSVILWYCQHINKGDAYIDINKHWQVTVFCCCCCRLWYKVSISCWLLRHTRNSWGWIIAKWDPNSEFITGRREAR